MSGQIILTNESNLSCIHTRDYYFGSCKSLAEYESGGDRIAAEPWPYVEPDTLYSLHIVRSPTSSIPYIRS